MHAQRKTRGACRLMMLAAAVAVTLPFAAVPAAAQDEELSDACGPENVRARTEGEAVLIEWEAVPNATGYVVHRGEASERIGFLVELDANQTHYLDESVMVGTTYTYQVTVLLPFGERQFETLPCSDVTATAIPGFPNLLAGVGAAALAMGAYASIRRR